MLRTLSNSTARFTLKSAISSSVSKCRPPPTKFISQNRPFSTCQILFRFDPDAFIEERKGDQDNRFNPGSQFEGRRRNDSKFDNVDLPTIKKNVFSENSEQTQAENSKDVEQFREENRISIVESSDQVPNPVYSFDELPLPPKMIEKLKKSGFEKPMPIQAQGWPIAMSGFDLIGIGETGSGKTLGFLLPAFQHILEQDHSRILKGPQVLVMSPTRELAQQTMKVAQSFSSILGLQTVAIYGGSSRSVQVNLLRNKVDIVVATPGRMNDLLETECAHLDRCTFVVLDEADRMLDMGFEPQIRSILDRVRPDRQMMMWSATWPKEVRNLGKDFFGKDKPLIHMNIGSTELQANPNIEQVIEVTDSHHDKKSKLFEFLREVPEGEKVLIFTATKRTADFLENLLYRERFRAVAIHGDKNQMARDRALYDFRNGRKSIMVATDVASRGIDVDDIKLVINFDMPTNIEDYIHRIGRTGRRGRQGKSVSMLETSEATKKLVKDLIEVLTEANQEVSPELRNLLKTASAEVYNRKFQNRRQNYGYNNNYNRRMDNYDRFGSRDRNDFDGDYGSRGYNRSFNNQSRHSNYNNRQRGSFDSIYDNLNDVSNPNEDRRQGFERKSNVSITKTSLYDSVLQNLKPKD